MPQLKIPPDLQDNDPELVISALVSAIHDLFSDDNEAMRLIQKTFDRGVTYLLGESDGASQGTMVANSSRRVVSDKALRRAVVKALAEHRKSERFWKMRLKS
jgi:hypothetical protein